MGGASVPKAPSSAIGSKNELVQHGDHFWEALIQCGVDLAETTTTHSFCASAHISEL